MAKKSAQRMAAEKMLAKAGVIQPRTAPTRTVSAAAKEQALAGRVAPRVQAKASSTRLRGRGTRARGQHGPVAEQRSGIDSPKPVVTRDARAQRAVAGTALGLLPTPAVKAGAVMKGMSKLIGGSTRAGKRLPIRRADVDGSTLPPVPKVTEANRVPGAKAFDAAMKKRPAHGALPKQTDAQKAAGVATQAVVSGAQRGTSAALVNMQRESKQGRSPKTIAKEKRVQKKTKKKAKGLRGRSNKPDKLMSNRAEKKIRAAFERESLSR